MNYLGDRLRDLEALGTIENRFFLLLFQMGNLTLRSRVCPIRHHEDMVKHLL